MSKYNEFVLNGTDPVLKAGLVPVVIDENGVVKKASESDKWYNYEEKQWANAVILENESQVYQNGEVIPESNIESYFVWIPRYRYKLFSNGEYTSLSATEKKEQVIEVEFENKEMSPTYGNQTGEWKSHPAFLSFDVNGIWVGKFETGYKSATTHEEAVKNVSYSSKITIKPNVYSWRGIQASKAFSASYDYQRNMNSHMMKNTEWGAIAILQQSVYGSQGSVRINNNSSFITGYAAKNEPTCGFTGKNEACNVYESTVPGVDGANTINYKDNLSVVASTTGNRSGVYDMSGSSQEYVMGVMVDKNGNPVSGKNDNLNSGFIGTLTSPSDGTNKTKTNWTVSDGGIPFPEENYYEKYGYGVK